MKNNLLNHIKTIVRFSVFLLPVLFLASCCVPKMHVPTLQYKQAGTETKGRKLMVFLPGLGGDFKDFDRYGFVEAVINADPAFDAVAVDLCDGYYVEGMVYDRLNEDVFEPARKAGYEEIWLTGTSLGGMGSFLYMFKYPHKVDGVILLGPHLGLNLHAEEIEKMGGLDKWEPYLSVLNFNMEDLLWVNIKRFKRHPEDYPAPVFIGYGVHDEFNGGQRLFSTILPPSRVYTNDGAHNWGTWKALFKVMVEEDGILKAR